MAADRIRLDNPSNHTILDSTIIERGSVDFNSPSFESNLSDTHKWKYEPISKLIIDSSLYQEAYKVFSSDTTYGQPYLVQLQLIPESHVIRDLNFWDDFVNGLGGSSKYESLIKDSFNQAMDEIRALVQSYYSFKNSLPVEQARQMGEAGYNSAITGQGLDPSSMDGAGSAGIVSPEPVSNAASSSSLNEGISSFVEFVGSMGALFSSATAGTSAIVAAGLAKNADIRAQQQHEVDMANQGVDVGGSLSSDPTVQNRVASGVASSTVVRAENESEAKVLDDIHTINVGDDPNSVGSYEIMTGHDVLNELSRYKLAMRYADGAIGLMRRTSDQLYAGALSSLENEYKLANFQSMEQESLFNRDFFSSRNGVTEGVAETNIAQSLSDIRSAEAAIRSFEQWKYDYRQQLLKSWSTQIQKRPYLTPFFYKGLFDFDMEDTFYHMSPWTSGLKYGMNALNGIGDFIGNITGFKKPAIKKGQTTTTTGPQGTTVSQTQFDY